MANYTSKFTGKEIDNILDKAKSGSGVPIVENVNDLDPNAPLGTLAVVVQQGNIQECSISDLPQMDPSKIDMNTGVIDTSNCPKVSSISFLIPESPNVNISSTGDADMLYFVSENISVLDESTGRILILLPLVSNNKLLGLQGVYMDMSTNTEKNWVLFGFDGETIMVDQSAIDECISYVNELYYLGNFMYIMGGSSVPTELIQFFDSIIKVVTSTPTETNVYQKKNNWEKLYNKEFAKLTTLDIKLRNLVDNKKIITTYDSYMELTPNRYHKNDNTWLSSLTITLGEITDSTIVNEYFVEFTTGSSTTVYLPASIKWNNGTTPEFKPNTTYQISIINNLGIVTSFKSNGGVN